MKNVVNKREEHTKIYVVKSNKSFQEVSLRVEERNSGEIRMKEFLDKFHVPDLSTSICLSTSV